MDLIQFYDALERRGVGNEVALQRQHRRAATAFLGLQSTGVIHENSSHHRRCQGEELLSVDANHVMLRGQPDVCLVYTTTLLGNSDVTTHVVQLEGPEDITVDYGHNDLFMADNAVELVYQPILDWMAAR